MRKEDYVYEKHDFVFSKPMGKSYCLNCGFVALNNDFSRWANDKGCKNNLHPSFESTRYKFTRLDKEK